MGVDDITRTTHTLEKEDDILRADGGVGGEKGEYYDNDKGITTAQEVQASKWAYIVGHRSLHVLISHSDLGMLGDDLALVEAKLQAATLEWTYAVSQSALSLRNLQLNQPR
jgi:hypothetical protein